MCNLFLEKTENILLKHFAFAGLCLLQETLSNLAEPYQSLFLC